MTTKAITIYRLEHARAALKAAEESGVAVTLLSPLNGAQQMGAPVFQTIVDVANKLHPKAQCASILDCGNEPGIALNAIEMGAPAISMSEENPKVSEIAKLSGSMVIKRPTDSLDLLDIETIEETCLEWLSA